MWRKYRTSIILGITFSLLLSMFWFFQSLAFVIFISLLLSLLLETSVERLNKKMPRSLAAFIVLTAFIALIIGSLALLSRSFIPTFTRFVADLPQLANSLQGLPFLGHSDFIAQEFESLFNEMTTFSVAALKSSLAMLLSLFNKFLDLIIIIFVTFYLLKDGKEIKSYYICGSSE